MNKKLLTIVLAGTFLTTGLLPALSNAGNGRMGGKGLHNQPKSTLQSQVRQKLHDGSCLSSGTSGAGALQQKGNAYGPGDSITGNQGDGPQDGTGYGATANQ